MDMTLLCFHAGCDVHNAALETVRPAAKAKANPSETLERESGID
jgi:hypothetical protein